MSPAYPLLAILSWLPPPALGQPRDQGRPSRPATEIQMAIEEFKLQTRNLGLRDDSPPKAGGNGRGRQAWHGRFYENFRNDFLDAVPHEIAQRGGAKGLLRRNQFGFNLSGPVVIPNWYHGGRRTFFTLSFEGMRESIGRTFLTTLATMPERAGDWSAVVDQAGSLLRIYDPATTRRNPAFDASRPVARENLEYFRDPFAANTIPRARLDPAARRALAFYPAPNANAGPFFRNNYFVLTPERSRAGGMIGRVDHTMRERHRVVSSMAFSDGQDGAARLFQTIANPGAPDRAHHSRRASIEHVFTASPRRVNILTVEASTERSRSLADVDPDGRPFPVYRFSPYLSMGRAYPSSRNARASLVATNAYSHRRGRHGLRAVGQISRGRVHTFGPQYPSGSFRFGPGLTSLPGVVNTGHGFASFLLGLAEFAESSVVLSPSYFRYSRSLVALRDQYEISKGLTLSLGVNLEINTPRVEKYDRQSTVDLEALNPENGRRGALAVAGGGRGRAFQPTRARLEPSASLAWNPRGDSRTVLRLSYSRAYSPTPVYSAQWGTQGFNGTPTWVSANTQLEPAVRLADGLPPPARPLPDLGPDAVNHTVADLIDATTRQPTYQSSSMSIERELPGAMVLTAGAGHSTGRNLLVGNTAVNPNAIGLQALSFRDRLNEEGFNRSLRPFPQYQRFDVYYSYPAGRYERDSSYLRLEKRTSSGLALTAYYEFSKQMDDYSGPYGIQDYYNRRNDWSLTAGSSPHRFSLSYVYELPLGPSREFLPLTDWRRHLVEGWSVSGMTTLASGDPIALRPQFNNTGNVVDALHVNVVSGADPRVARPGPHLWFDPAAFAHPPDFTIGDASRTHPALLGPGNQNHDLSLIKRFSLPAERTVEISAAGFNFVNHANWNDPDTTIGPPGAPNVNAGRIIGSRGGRVVQLGVRFSF